MVPAAVSEVCMRARPLLLALALLLATLRAAPAFSTLRATTYLRTPLAFEANRGQAASDVRFLARGSGYTMLLAPDAIEMRLHARASDAASARSAVVRMRFVGGAEHPAVTGGETLAGYGNYLVGNDPTRWATHVPLSARVR